MTDTPAIRSGGHIIFEILEALRTGPLRPVAIEDRAPYRRYFSSPKVPVLLRFKNSKVVITYLRQANPNPKREQIEAQLGAKTHVVTIEQDLPRYWRHGMTSCHLFPVAIYEREHYANISRIVLEAVEQVKP